MAAGSANAVFAGIAASEYDVMAAPPRTVAATGRAW